MTTLVTYNKGMDLPIVTGRPCRNARHWEATITMRYNHMTEVVEFRTHDRCRASDLIAVATAEVAPLVAQHGEPVWFGIKARAV